MVKVANRLVYEGDFTIVNYTSGACVSFNHRTKNIRYASTNGTFFDTPYEDDSWVDMMNRHNLWRSAK